MTPLAFWLRIFIHEKISLSEFPETSPIGWLAWPAAASPCQGLRHGRALCIVPSTTWAISGAFDSGISQDSSYLRCACAGGEHLNGFPLNFSRSHWATPGEAEQNCPLHHWVWGEVKKYGLFHSSNDTFSNDSPWLLSWSPAALWEGIASH